MPQEEREQHIYNSVKIVIAQVLKKSKGYKSMTNIEQLINTFNWAKIEGRELT